MKLITIFILSIVMYVSEGNDLPIYKLGYQLHFLVKTPLVTNPNAYGQHIRINQDLNDFELRIDDRAIIKGLKYSKYQKEKILTEYLTFEKDTTTSDKYYYFRTENYKGQWQRPNVENFTIEIEALFSFTKMLTKGVTPLYPAIIKRSDKKVVNGDRKAIGEIFDIYRKWFAASRHNNFKKITLPLSGSAYQWLNEEKVANSALIDSL